MPSDNVIHIDFATGSRQKAEAQQVAEKPKPRAVEPEPIRDRPDDPLAALYSIGDVARLFSLQVSRLRYWDRIGFLQPSGVLHDRRYYTFQDLIGVRAAKGLIDKGVPLRHVRRSVEALKSSLPKVVRPLSELRVLADGSTLVVRTDVGTFEPMTGQLVLDFEVKDLRDDVVRVLRQGSRSDVDRRAAYEHYLEGCRLDEEETTYDRAEQAYLRAIEIDPSLANAITNLGNLRFRRGNAEQAEYLYRKALEVDASQPEALYNLGFLSYERGELQHAAGWFAQALENDPSFADAHFNLAMALEEVGNGKDAREHWEKYLELDPAGPWAEIARRHLS